MKQEEIREQILEAARNVFIEKGYKGTTGSTTLEVTEIANISEVILILWT